MAETYSMPERRGIPRWLAVALIGLALAGGGYFAYEYGYKGSGFDRVEAVAVAGPAQSSQRQGNWLGRLFGGGNRDPERDRDRDRAERGSRAYRPDIPEGVSRSSVSRAIYARKGNVAVRAQADDRPGDPWLISIEFLDSHAWVPREQVNLARVARALTASPRLAEYVGLSDAQMKQLLELQDEARLTDGERAEFESLFRAWDRANSAKDAKQRKELADKLIAAVAQSAARHLPAARAHVQSRAERISKVLTAEQIAKARQGPLLRDRTAARERRPTARVASTKPTTRPAAAPTRPATRPAAG